MHSLVAKPRLKIRSADSWATAHFVTVRSKFFLKKTLLKLVRAKFFKKNLSCLKHPLPLFQIFLGLSDLIGLMVLVDKKDKQYGLRYLPPPPTVPVLTNP